MDALKKAATCLLATLALAAFLGMTSPALAQPAAAQPASMETPAPAAAPASWNQLRSLVGTWQARHPDGKVTRASYELVSNGSALVERLETPGEPSMMTVYTLDGGTPMLTHYCSLGNQPRMRAVPADRPGVVSFAFADATNLASPQAPHMQGLKISIADPDHFTAEWTMRAAGKDVTEPFSFERMK